MNYSTLLRRSVDFEPYAEGQFTADDLRRSSRDRSTPSAPLPEDTPLGPLRQLPRRARAAADPVADADALGPRRGQRLRAPHDDRTRSPNTPTHEVLLHPAFGDHQVANVTAEVEARTIGASVYQPALDPGRHWEADGSNQIFGIPAIPAFPFSGSALVYWDGGPLGFDDPFDADMTTTGLRRRRTATSRRAPTRASAPTRTATRETTSRRVPRRPPSCRRRGRFATPAPRPTSS